MKVVKSHKSLTGLSLVVLYTFKVSLSSSLLLHVRKKTYYHEDFLLLLSELLVCFVEVSVFFFPVGSFPSESVIGRLSHRGTRL